MPINLPFRVGVCKCPKFKSIWREVDKQITKLELLRMCHPSVPFDVRVEVVITGDSFVRLPSTEATCHR